MTVDDTARVERVARAMRDECIARNGLSGDALSWDEAEDEDRAAWLYSARAAIAAADACPPEGYALVPKLPTVGMLAALTRNLGEGSGMFAGKWGIGSFNEDYAAMLAAAPLPAPPQEKDDKND